MMAVKNPGSLDQFYQECFIVDFEDLRCNIELKDLTNQKISAKFTDKGFILPENGFVIDLPRTTLAAKIAEIHKRADNRFAEPLESGKDGAMPIIGSVQEPVKSNLEGVVDILGEKKSEEPSPEIAKKEVEHEVGKPEVGNFVAMAEHREREKLIRERTKPETGMFKNWAETLNIEVRYKYPKNEDELQQILAESANNVNEKIGIMGSGHSWENIFVPPNELLINMDFYFPFKDLDKKKVRILPDHRLAIAAGCSIMRKHRELGWEKDDHVLPSCVIYTDVQYVGVVSGGCHGCHFRDGSVPDRVENIVLYSAEGTKVQIPKDEIPVAAIGLGSLGVISEIELRMEPEKRVLIESYMWTMQEMMEAIKNNYKKWISYEVYWVPFGGITFGQALWCAATGNLPEDYSVNDQYYCQIVREHEEKDKHVNSDLISVVFQDIWKTVIPEIQKSQVHVTPNLRYCTPLLQYMIQKILSNLVSNLQSFAPIVTSMYNSIHYLPLVELLPLQAQDIELCLHCGKKGEGDFDNIKLSFEKLEKEIRHIALTKKKFPVDLIVEGRICERSICPLSPSYSTEPGTLFFYFECLAFPNTIGWEEFADSFFKAMKEIDGTVKPHFAKEWKGIQDIVPHLKEVAGEGIKNLRILQKKYDPHGKFMSPALEPLFQD